MILYACIPKVLAMPTLAQTVQDYILYCTVIYEQRERVFHRDIKTRENNV